MNEDYFSGKDKEMLKNNSKASKQKTNQNKTWELIYRTSLKNESILTQLREVKRLLDTCIYNKVRAYLKLYMSLELEI